MIQLYTQSFYIRGRVKRLLRSLLKDNTSGPLSVQKSLETGLTELGVEYTRDKSLVVGGNVGVLSGTHTLAGLLAKKSDIGHLVAGPNIVVSPFEYNRLITDTGIDTVLVPSQWVKDYYAAVVPDMSQRIRVWAAGVSVPNVAPVAHDIDLLVYNKMTQSSLAHDIVSWAQQRGLRVITLTYGTFVQADYFAILARSRFLVYLSQSESQGLALFEAWARDVPSLVFESGSYERDGVQITGKISAPYLTDECGFSFQDLISFAGVYERALHAVFSPQKFVLEGFTNRHSAEQYLQLFNHD